MNFKLWRSFCFCRWPLALFSRIFRIRPAYFFSHFSIETVTLGIFGTQFAHSNTNWTQVNPCCNLISIAFDRKTYRSYYEIWPENQTLTDYECDAMCVLHLILDRLSNSNNWVKCCWRDRSMKGSWRNGVHDQLVEALNKNWIELNVVGKVSVSRQTPDTRTHSQAHTNVAFVLYTNGVQHCRICCAWLYGCTHTQPHRHTHTSAWDICHAERAEHEVNVSVKEGERKRANNELESDDTHSDHSATTTSLFHIVYTACMFIAGKCLNISNSACRRLYAIASICSFSSYAY